MKRMHHLMTVAVVAAALLIPSCEKMETEKPQSLPGGAPAQSVSRQASIADIQRYHDAIALGTLDLLDDSFFVNSAISLALATYDISDYTDYYAYLDELAAVFANANRNLLEEMLNSVANHTEDVSIINMLRNNGFSYQSGDYSFRPRLFLIHLDEMSYQSPTQVARLSFSNQDLGVIPVWGWNQLANNFSQNTANVSVLDSNPVWVASSSIIDTRNSEEVDVVALEAGGKKKCKESNTTGWCVNSGKGCKCHYKDAINYAQANMAVINAFVNGTLDVQYYIND